MTDDELVNQMIERGYMVALKGKYNLTGNFHRNYVPVSSTGLVVAKKEIATNASQAIVTQQEKVLGIKELLKRFREDAEIPFRISNDGGKPFTANAISADGVKAFGDILKSGINYEMLVYTTKLYYQSDSYRKGLTNYLVQGDWEGAYMEFGKNMQQGKIESYIKSELGTFGKDI